MNVILFNTKTGMPVHTGGGMIVLKRLGFLLPPTDKDIEYRCFILQLPTFADKVFPPESDASKQLVVDAQPNGYIWLTDKPVFDRQVPMYFQCIATGKLVEPVDQIAIRCVPVQFVELESCDPRKNQLKLKKEKHVFASGHFWLRGLYAAAG